MLVEYPTVTIVLGIFSRLARRLRWALITKIIFSMVVLAYGATISVTSNNYQAEIGSVVTFATGLPSTDKGFSLASSGLAASATGTSCSTPTVFSPSPSIANNVITAGHQVYDVQINQTSGAAPATKFNVTFTLGSTVYAPLCILTLATPVSGQIIDCKYDVGSSLLPSSPYTFKISVK